MSSEGYFGRPTRRLQSDYLWVDALAEAGPRLVRLGLVGSSANLLAETPDEGWQTPQGRYDLLGGHRLWFAPEDSSRVAVPDAQGLVVEEDAPGIRLRGPAEPSTGLERSISVRLDPSAPVMELCHEIRNVGDRPVELSPWPITQLPLGSVVLLPQPAAITDHEVRPNRTLVLWPYTSWDDDRLELHDGLIMVRGTAGPPLKVGYFNTVGRVAYLHGSVLVVRHFDPAPGFPHPDLGCNVETYCGPRYQELEILGPLAHLEPGRSVVLSERWELSRVGGGAVDPLQAAITLMRSERPSADQPDLTVAQAASVSA